MSFSILRTTNLTKYYLYSLKTTPLRLFIIVTWPISDLLIWSFTAKYVQNSYMISAFLVTTITNFLFWIMLWQTQSETVHPFMRDVWSKSLHNILTTPTNFVEITIGLFLASMFKVTISTVSMIIISILLFSVNIINIQPIFILYVINILLFGLILGILSISLIVRLGPQIEFFTRSLPFVLWPLMCIYYPRNGLPAVFRSLSYFVPVSYIFESIRSNITLNSIDYPGLWVSSLLNFVYLAISITILCLMLAQSKKHGLLTRM